MMRSIGRHSLVVIGWFAVLGAASSVPAEGLPEGTRSAHPDLRLLVPQVAPGGLGDTEVAFWTRGRREVVDHERTASPQEAGTVITVPNGCRSGRTYVLRNATHVSAPLTPEPGGCDEPLALTVYPAAEVDGELLPPEQERLGGHGELEVLKCRSSPHDPRQVLGVYPIAIDPPESSDRPENEDESVPEDLGVWSAAIPAECVDLYLSTGELARLIWRTQALDPQSSVHLGRHQLKYASTLVVRLADAAGKPVPRADLRLIEAEDLSRFIHSSPTSFFTTGPPRNLPLSAVTDRQGWARFENLDVGVFQLEVRSVERPPFFSDPIETEPRLTTTLDPLTLPPTAELEVLLEGFDSDGAAGAEGARVMVTRYEEPEEGLLGDLAVPKGEFEALLRAMPRGVGGGLREQRHTEVRLVEPAKGAAAASSSDSHIDTSVPRRAVFQGMTPGTWSVYASAHFAERSFPVDFDQSRVHLEPGSRASVSLEYRYRRYSGLVTYQGRPAEAQVFLDCEPRDCSEGGRATTDEEGHFQVLLASPGPYKVGITLQPGSGREATVTGVRFDDPDETVEIEVTSLEARLEGQVVDTQGEGVAAVYVHARGLSESGGLPRSTVFADSEGHFEFLPMAPGEWLLTAEDGNVSGVLEVRLEPDARRSVQLVLDLHGSWTGTVTAGGFGVAGVEGQLTPVQGNGLLYEYELRSDDAGRFVLNPAPRPGTRLNVALGALGASSLPATAFTVTATDGMVLEAPRQGGEVRLAVDPTTGSIGTYNLYLVADSGAWLPLTLTRPERLKVGLDSAEIWKLPYLAATRWRLVAAGSMNELGSVASGNGHLMPALATFTVLPDQVVEVEAVHPDDDDP